jgi:cell division protein FtsB
MNNYPYPFIPMTNNINVVEEIYKLKQEIKDLKEKINQLENTNNKEYKENNYLKNNKDYYML